MTLQDRSSSGRRELLSDLPPLVVEFIHPESESKATQAESV